MTGGQQVRIQTWDWGQIIRTHFNCGQQVKSDLLIGAKLLARRFLPGAEELGSRFLSESLELGHILLIGARIHLFLAGTRELGHRFLTKAK